MSDGMVVGVGDDESIRTGQSSDGGDISQITVEKVTHAGCRSRSASAASNRWWACVVPVTSRDALAEVLLRSISSIAAERTSGCAESPR